MRDSRSEEIVDTAFETLPRVFMPPFAKDWEGCIHFNIKGGTDWSVVVSKGRCETLPELIGEATCLVAVDVETWASVITGRSKAETAFIKGEMTATNLGDMLRLAKAFDLEKVITLMAASEQAAVSSGDEKLGEAFIERTFALLPKVFVPMRAKRWNANIQFQIKNASDWTLLVQNEQCEVIRGFEKEATCRVVVDDHTWISIVSGQERFESAFMAGRISATNLAEMMKFGITFELDKLSALLEPS